MNISVKWLIITSILIFFLIVIPIKVSVHAEINPKDGLITYLKLDENSDVIMDSEGTIEGKKHGTTLVDNNILFNGENDFIELNNHNLKNIGQGSISVWFKVQDIPERNGIRPILYYGAKDPCTNMPDASNQGVIIEVGHDPMHYNSKNLYFTIFAEGCEYPTFCYDSNKGIKEDQWYHFVAIVGEDYNTGYLNGEEMVNRRYNFGDSNSSQFFEDAVRHEAMWIGKGYWNGKPDFFKGSIKNIRIYNRVLNEDEIKFLYNNKI